ncbi:ABC transporter ATP-binding protein [Enterococcus raffinosus]|uniref:ABC transporter ATP-binding protein n=1 Tax=Enterococcus raffinosus TaxID=71452 RepID=A0AAW8T4J5_9ENTE|nr:ABC transporter ATP-binding protein [Enterococcus raffinosus]MDT2522662.1 ABC transporter ATP-binding protein [Enterococcus raffinosus]MDT2529948.1 ABC transporter ATP-binding protein [Enterococcus raffinosus]MDT2532972.1 ABC transporter ATP-binding protein [Enterococcus raffinosus]MDT2543843.1 ABC transporter ATP-binding protein [Enterococcus raffinosus]MDT2555018.1 ABC transporter ATP-binding protein [Enterococcus raffinosus]
MKSFIEVKNLEKSYKNKQVIHGISFSIYQGEILCLLGPNGASKSTTINILCGALGFDGGEVTCKGDPINQNLQAFKQQLGVVPQDLALYEDLTAEKNVRFFASLYGLKGKELEAGVTFALESVGLNSHRKERVATFSGGMKRRLNIACAIAHHPKLLIMDEPTVGIDPQSRNHILTSIKNMQLKGMTVLYTTHYMEEVEEISSRIIIIDHGRIIAEGTKEALKEKNDERKITIEISDSNEISLDAFYQIEGVKEVTLNKDELLITSIKGIENLDHIIGKLISLQQKIQNVFVQEANLETIFLDLTGRSLRD